jgi:hypothetical protein
VTLVCEAGLQGDLDERSGCSCQQLLRLADPFSKKITVRRLSHRNAERTYEVVDAEPGETGKFSCRGRPG